MTPPRRRPANITVRSYEPEDAAETLAIFLGAVTETASADYSPEQIEVWAQPGRRDVASWHEAMKGRDSLVAVVGGRVAGFSDVGPDGYIDMMFVSPRFLRGGAATALMTHIEETARCQGSHDLWANVSITARPFFERHGFHVEAEQHPVRLGVQLTNYRMRKALL
ncbi:GNAT family N-acetyltransferase [Leifsonia sp. fls2-241-R2A-40a]|uniref:GNAT family N-acetyltransferase n=1 Tax=Leifsonia sp. fls2-241-R2A-40a TaxID=3040290 RepID=UPI00254F47C8|nr:GNAT family N-acetyltransferase [Leifsonia sp. fls2-241-R2A-40a]